MNKTSKIKQQAFILFGEGNDTNKDELNLLLGDGWYVVNMCSMSSSVSTTTAANDDCYTRFFEPQCVIILERKI